MIAYYYIKKEDTEETCECGLKLSVWCNTEIIPEDFKKKAMIAYLSPKDHMEKYNHPMYDCLKLDINDEKLYIVDYVYHEMGDEKRYEDSVIKAKDYIIGMYRKPVFAITYTVLGDYITVLDKNMDIPILYDSSEEIYLKRMHALLEDEDEKFYDRALLGYLEKHEDSMMDDSNQSPYKVITLHNQSYVVRTENEE